MATYNQSVYGTIQTVSITGNLLKNSSNCECLNIKQLDKRNNK